MQSTEYCAIQIFGNNLQKEMKDVNKKKTKLHIKCSNVALQAIDITNRVRGTTHNNIDTTRTFTTKAQPRVQYKELPAKGKAKVTTQWMITCEPNIYLSITLVKMSQEKVKAF